MPHPSSNSTAASASSSSRADRSIAHDQLQVMLWQEVTTYQTTDYLDHHQQQQQPRKRQRQAPSSNVGAISKQWREVICEWAYKCKFLVERETRLD